jgi:hypothetical protein
VLRRSCFTHYCSAADAPGLGGKRTQGPASRSGTGVTGIISELASVCLDSIQFGSNVALPNRSTWERIMNTWESFFREKSRRRSQAAEIRAIVRRTLGALGLLAFIVAGLVGLNSYWFRA